MKELLTEFKIANDAMFELLEKINRRPEPYEFYTTPDMWNDPYVSGQMLKYHLMEDVDLASRNMDFIDRSANWIINEFKIGNETSVCDFGCGPGLYTARFAGTGADVTGIDLSESSIEYALKESLRNDLPVNYVIANYLEYDTNKKFDLITLIFCDFCVLNPKQRDILLAKFVKLLQPNGKLLVDVSTHHYFYNVEPTYNYEYVKANGFWSAESHYVFNHTFKYDGKKLLLNKHAIIEKNRTREFFNWLKCYSLPELRDLFSRHGLEITNCFGNIAGDSLNDDSNEMAVIAEVKS